MIFGITAELIDLPLAMAIIAKALKPVPSIHEGGIAHGSKLALIGDEPGKAEVIIPDSALDFVSMEPIGDNISIGFKVKNYEY